MTATRKRRRLRLVAAVLLAGLVPSGGCAPFPATGVRSGYESGQGLPRCTAGTVGPGAAILVSLPVAALGWFGREVEDFFRGCDEYGCPPADRTMSNTFFTASGILLGVGVLGAVQVSRCNAERERYRAAQTSHENAATGNAAVSTSCQAWQRRLLAATTMDEQHQVARETPPECRAGPGTWPVGVSSRP